MKLKFTVALLIMVLICSGYLYALDMEGLVLYLPLDGGNGEVAEDLSGSGNNGELQGNVERVEGKSGNGVYISDDSADNRILVEDSDSLDITNEMTIAMWVLLESLTGSCAIITKADTYMIHSSDWSGEGIEQELLLWPFDDWQTEASTPIQFGEWRHVVGIYDGEEIRMYIDGELKGQRARTGEIAVTDNNLVIGRDNRDCCNDRVFALTVDEVMIFNRALTDNEVSETMAGVAPVEPKAKVTTTWANIKK